MPRKKTTSKTPAKKRARGSVATAPEEQRPLHEVTKNYDVTQELSVPMVKFNDGDRYAITIQDVIRQNMPGSKSKEPATILRATDLDTGEINDYISTTVLSSTLERAYGKVEFADIQATGPIKDATAWVGKSILVTCSKREKKRYMDVRVQEITPK